MADKSDDNADVQLNADEEELLEQMPELAGVGVTRRAFLGYSIAGSLGLFALDLLAQEEALAAIKPPPDAVFAPAPAARTS